MGFFSSSIEKQIERQYIDMFINMIGLSPNDAGETVKEMIKRSKQNIEETGEDKYPHDMADRIVNDPKFAPALEKRRIDGVKDEDIIWWWGELQPIERGMMLLMDEYYRVVLFTSEMEGGKTADEATNTVRKAHPIYGDSDDTSNVDGDNVPLPVELKDRVNIYIEKRATTDPEKYKKEMEKSTSFNALVRREIKDGNL